MRLENVKTKRLSTVKLNRAKTNDSVSDVASEETRLTGEMGVFELLKARRKVEKPESLTPRLSKECEISESLFEKDSTLNEACEKKDDFQRHNRRHSTGETERLFMNVKSGSHEKKDTDSGSNKSSQTQTREKTPIAPLNFGLPGFFGNYKSGYYSSRCKYSEKGKISNEELITRLPGEELRRGFSETHRQITSSPAANSPVVSPKFCSSVGLATSPATPSPALVESSVQTEVEKTEVGVQVVLSNEKRLQREQDKLHRRVLELKNLELLYRAASKLSCALCGLQFLAEEFPRHVASHGEHEWVALPQFSSTMFFSVDVQSSVQDCFEESKKYSVVFMEVTEEKDQIGRTFKKYSLKINCQTGGSELSWIISHRFSEFLELHRMLQKTVNPEWLPPIRFHPQFSVLPTSDETIIEKRIEQIQGYIPALLSCKQTRELESVKTFLKLP